MKKSLGSKTIAYPTPVWCVGSYDQNNVPNVMTAAWGGICCSKPPCVTVSLRKATYTYGNIMNKKAYTVSVPSEKYASEVDYFGIASGRDVNKFEISGLTPVKSDKVDAPYIAEFPVILECNVLHTYDIGLHTLFIGEIVDVKAEEAVLAGDKGIPDVEKIKPIIYGPESRTYHGVGAPLGLAFDLGMDLYKAGKKAP
jgi:flavin reductase (DIM6/NTAB) family NADH-FMN oxidoreductase RutF